MIQITINLALITLLAIGYEQHDAISTLDVSMSQDITAHNYKSESSVILEQILKTLDSLM